MKLNHYQSRTLILLYRFPEIPYYKTQQDMKEILTS